MVADPKPYELVGNRHFRETSPSSIPGRNYLEPGLGIPRTINIVDQVLDSAKVGIDARFYGPIMLKEQDILALAPGEWERILDRMDAFVSETGAIKMPQDDVGAYARSKVQTHLTHASYEKNTDVLRVAFAGSPSVSLRLQIFDEHCRERMLSFDPFEARLEESIQLGEWLSE